MRSIVLLLFVAGALALDFPPPPRPSITIDAPEHGEGKIINGVNANPGQFPYIASLNYKGDGHACGVSILTSSWVLTAAHCCLAGDQLVVYTSSIYLSNGGRTYDIAQKIVHPQYDPNNYWHNDICVIRINGNIPFDGNTQQVTLAPDNFVVPDGGQVVIPGWGYTTASAPQQSPDRLQVVTSYKGLSKENCAQRTGIAAFDGHICCISDVGQAVCQGDSGGPLTYNGAQVGVTSFVFLPCAGTGYPDYFTRVPNYNAWIRQNIGAVEAEKLKFARLEDLV